MKLQDIPNRVHFVGVGGIGVSALAQYLVKRGYTVSGSDRQINDRTQFLQTLGVRVAIGHDADAVRQSQLVVRTSAVHDSDEDIAATRQNKIPVISREELLGVIFDSFPVRIAVCGTHGKTTVTAMIHHILKENNVDHAAFIGGVFNGNNFYDGKGIVVAEACEYNRSFMYLHPTVTVCLNAEFDHPDCYKDENDVLKAFCRFLQNTEQDGSIVLPRKLNTIRPNRKTVFYDENIDRSASSECRGNVFCINGVKCSLSVVGEHNVYNAAAAIAAANCAGISHRDAAAALQSFTGVDRRWTESSKGDFTVVRDYAHHPTEITCSVKTAKNIAKGRVLCVFQPHTYTRTQALWSDFVSCFKLADRVCYMPIYPARESPIFGITSQNLCSDAVKDGMNACYADGFAEAAAWVKENARAGDVVLVLGAGDVVELADMLS